MWERSPLFFCAFLNFVVPPAPVKSRPTCEERLSSPDGSGNRRALEWPEPCPRGPGSARGVSAGESVGARRAGNDFLPTVTALLPLGHSGGGKRGVGSVFLLHVECVTSFQTGHINAQATERTAQYSAMCAFCYFRVWHNLSFSPFLLPAQSSDGVTQSLPVLLFSLMSYLGILNFLQGASYSFFSFALFFPAALEYQLQQPSALCVGVKCPGLLTRSLWFTVHLHFLSVCC